MAPHQKHFLKQTIAITYYDPLTCRGEIIAPGVSNPNQILQDLRELSELPDSSGH